MGGKLFVFLGVVASLLGPIASASNSVPSTKILEWVDAIEATPSTREFLDDASLRKLYSRVFYHPVASLDATSKYDTPKGEIGYCFGRAMAAHLIARKEFSLKPTSVRKLFIIGNLLGEDGTAWRFHVTTLVLAKPHGARAARYYAIDPIFGQPLTVEQWVASVTRDYDHKEKAYLYLTDPVAMMPDVRIFPSEEEEKGEHIIELKFRPQAKEFKSTLINAREVYQSTKAVQEKYFLVSNSGKTGFDFNGLTINKARFDFKNYFAQLLMELRGELKTNEMRSFALPSDRLDRKKMIRSLGLKSSMAFEAETQP